MIEAIRELDEYIFGETFEEIFNGQPGYSEQTTAAIWQRFYEDRQAVGKTAIFNVVRDGEVGHSIMVSSLTEQPIKDPLENGI